MRRTTSGTWFVAAALSAALSTATCATGSTGSRYPHRPPNCAIRISHKSTPPVPEWDDLGMAEVGCPLEEGPSTCLARLKAEGCRMGGDIIYDVPTRPERPVERALVYRGHVAHTKTTTKTTTPEVAEEPAASGPVVPIAATPPPAPAPDAGAAPPDAAIEPTPDAANLTP